MQVSLIQCDALRALNRQRLIAAARKGHVAAFQFYDCIIYTGLIFYSLRHRQNIICFSGQLICMDEARQFSILCIYLNCITNHQGLIGQADRFPLQVSFISP